MPTLKEFLAGNPAAKAEYDALHPATPPEPRVEPKPKAPVEPAQNAEASFQSIVAAARPFLTADYPDAVKNLAADVIAGAAPPAALVCAVSAVDAIREERKSQDAKDETEGTGSLDPPKTNTNGGEDYVALAQSLRVAQGLAPRKLEVH